MTEKQLQPKIIKYLKDKGWLAMKGDYSLKGMPDIIAFRNGKTLMIEVKGAGIKPPPLQLHRIDQLKSLGIPAMWTNNFDEIKLIIDIIDQKIKESKDDNNANNNGSINYNTISACIFLNWKYCPAGNKPSTTKI